MSLSLDERVRVLEEVVSLLADERLEGDDLASARALLKGTIKCPHPGCSVVWRPGLLSSPGEDRLTPRPCPEHKGVTG